MYPPPPMEGVISKTNYSPTPHSPRNSVEVGGGRGMDISGTAQWQIKTGAFPRSSRNEYIYLVFFPLQQAYSLLVQGMTSTSFYQIECNC